MPGRVNHRGWIVLESIASDDGSLCVDFVRFPDGGYGFEQFRADPEDGGHWTAVGGYGATRFETAVDAAAEAAKAVVWLTEYRQASRSFNDWCAHLGTQRT